MKINASLVSQLRESQAWTQDELATSAGINLRTVQRIENTGVASLQTVKCLAAALEVDLDDLVDRPGMKMRYEFKTVVLPFRFGLFKKGIPDLESPLNEAGLEGWSLKSMITPSSDMSSDSIVAVLQRPLP